MSGQDCSEAARLFLEPVLSSAVAVEQQPPASPVRCYELLDLLMQGVERLPIRDARRVMAEVSTFETDWWGANG
jgi:hypothetical protein